MSILSINSLSLFKGALLFQGGSSGLAFLMKKLKYLPVKPLVKKYTTLFLLCLLPEMAFASSENTREKIKSMRESVLVQLYTSFPDIEDELIKASGYAVFSQNNFLLSNQEIGLLPSHVGRGIVTDNVSGNEIFMKVKGPLAQIKAANKQALNTVIIFHNHETLNYFITHGWDFSGKAARGADQANTTKNNNVDLAVQGVEVIYLTKQEQTRKASVFEHKFWLDNQLN